MSNRSSLIDFIFVGSYSPSDLIDASIRERRNGIDFATNNYQKNLVKCFSLTSFKYFALLSPFFAPSSNYILKRLPSNEIGSFYLPFSSIPVLRNGVEFFLVFSFLVLNYITYRGPFIVFSLHSSFLAAIFLFKLLTFNFSSVCVVLDDMPAHMFSASSPLFSFLKRLDSLVLKFFSFFVSHYILLSPHMKHLGFIKTKSNFMLEGFSSPLPSDITQSLNPTLTSYTDYPYFVYAGNLSPTKGVVDLIHGFDTFLSSNPESNALLLLSGSASLRDIHFLKNLLSSRKNIILLPSLSDKDLSFLLNGCTASVVPTSPSEPFARFFFPLNYYIICHILVP